MIPLYKPYMPELPEINSILHSGMLAYGEYTEKFEQKLKEYFCTPYLITTSSFQMAIYVALSVLGIKRGEDIIASPMACLASTQPYLSYGLNIKWCDVDPQVGTLNPNFLEKVLTPNTKAIVHNHFCGYPGYIDEVNDIGQKYGIPVIDDGIECFGSEYHGMKIGNCGTDVTVFSLSSVRFCNCIDGGIVIFKDRSLYEKSLLIRDLGIDRSQFRDEIGEINIDYDISLVGYSATMSNINGYIGLKQMEKIEELLHKHRLNANLWNRTLQKQDNVMSMNTSNNNPNYWVYGVLSLDKDETIKFFRNKGYYASGVHIRNDIYSIFGKNNVGLPGVELFYKSFVALPCGWWM